MRTELRHAGAQVCFVLLDLDDGERAAARDLAFAAHGDVFVRSFPAGESIDAIYARFAATAPALLAQAARRERAPWEQALERLVPLAGGVDWWLAGSAAVAARGGDESARS